MKTIPSGLWSRDGLGLLYIAIFLFPLFVPVTLTGQSICGPDTSFTDILFVIDNSGSIDEVEYDTLSNLIVRTIDNIQDQCPGSQLGVMHYGGAFGGETFLEYNLSSSHVIQNIKRQFCTERNDFGNCLEGGGDDLNLAMEDIIEFLGNGLLNRRPLNKLELVLLTDASSISDSCSFINCSVMKPLTNIDILKSRYGANVTVVDASGQSESSLLSLYASPGVSIDVIDSLPQECINTFDGCQLPRKYIVMDIENPRRSLADIISTTIDCRMDILHPMEVDLGMDQSVCALDNDTITLTANIINERGIINVEWSQNTSTGRQISVSPSTSTAISVIATDTTGCSAVDTVLISVIDCSPDCEAPVIIGPSDFSSCPTSSIDPATTGMPALLDPSTNDLDICTDPILSYSDEIIEMGDCPSQMIIKRTFTARYSVDPTSTSNYVQIISLVDTTAPIILRCVEDVLLDPNNPTYDWEDPLVQDDCEVSISYSIPRGSIFNIGVTRVTTFATDPCGHTDTCSFVVTVPEPVQILCPKDTVITCKQTMSVSDIVEAEAISSCPLCLVDPDNCVLVDSRVTNTTREGNLTIYEITHQASDLCNTQSSCTSTITMESSFFVDCPEDIVVQAAPYGFVNVSWDEPTYQTCCALCQIRDIPGFLYMGQLGKSYYYCSYARVNWSKAQATAIQHNGHLLAINTEEENEFIARRLLERYAYIGLSDLRDENIYQWTNGDTLTYQNWKIDPVPGGDNGNVTQMNSQGFWFDVEGRDKREFVMEIEGCRHVDQISGPSQGSRFRIGKTPISYAFEDGCGNKDTCAFDIVVTPYEPFDMLSLTNELRIHNDILVSPNPASSSMLISLEGYNSIQSIQIYKVNGQSIEVIRSIHHHKYLLDVTRYDSGLYFIRIVTTDGDIFQKKVVIQ